MKIKLLFFSFLFCFFLDAQIGCFYGGTSYFEAERFNKGTNQRTDFDFSPSIFIGLNRPFFESNPYKLGYYLELEKFLLREDRVSSAADYDLYHLNGILFSSYNWTAQSALILKGFYTISLGDVHNKKANASISNELGDFNSTNYGYEFAIDYIHPDYSNMKLELSYRKYINDFLDDRFDQVHMLKQFRITLFIVI